MKQHKPGSIVVGVDVGGPKKGFHAVAIQDGQYREQLFTLREKRKVSGTNISEIVDDPDAALEQFRLIANDLGNDTEKG